MNRMEEYRTLMAELEQPVQELELTLDRAQKKRRRRRHITRPLAGLAASFALFVLLVNIWTPAAYACSKIPILRELAEAVTFSPSLSDAVDNDYVQPLHLWQVDGDVTAAIEYLIVDQKQVNVFYRLDSDVYTQMNAEPKVLNKDGESPASCSYGTNDWNVPNGELQSITIDFIDDDVPDQLRLQLNIQDNSLWTEHDMSEPADAVSHEDAMFEDFSQDEREYVAHFDFLLEFDPQFTAAGRHYKIDKTVTLDGQQITITDIDIYPTHLRVNIADSPENTAWLKALYFYIETDWGMKFEPISNGITATGDIDSQTMVSYRAESSYFYDAKHLELVITGAQLLQKDMEKIHLDLRTGECSALPEDVIFHASTQTKKGWLVEFEGIQQKENHTHQLFSQTYYDPDGIQYHLDSWSSTFGDMTEDGNISTFIEMFPLKDYPYDEVWLCPQYSHYWTAEEVVAIIVK